MLKISDVIVDIVETGTTLKENNLQVIDKIFEISARVVANKSACKFKGNAIIDIVEKLVKAVENYD